MDLNAISFYNFGICIILGFSQSYLVLKSICLFLKSSRFKVIDNISDGPLGRVRKLTIFHRAVNHT